MNSSPVTKDKLWVNEFKRNTVRAPAIKKLMALFCLIFFFNKDCMEYINILKYKAITNIAPITPL